VADGARKERHSPRHSVKGIRLNYSKGGLLSFLSKGSAGQELPVVNVSTDGLQFLAGKAFAVGERLKIHVAGLAPGEPIDVECEVRWCRRVPRRAAHRVGVMFLAEDPGTHRRLEEVESGIEGQTMKLACPGCGVTVAVSRRHEGRSAKCPRCQAPMKLVPAEELPEIPEEQRVRESSGVIPAAQPGKGPAAAPAARSRLSAELNRFIRKTVRNRLHLELIQHFAGGEQHQVAGVKELSDRLKVPEKKVQLALRELVLRGVLKEIGIKTFNYDPAPGPMRDISDLLEALASAARRSEVMSLIIKTENRRK